MISIRSSSPVNLHKQKAEAQCAPRMVLAAPVLLHWPPLGLCNFKQISNVKHEVINLHVGGSVSLRVNFVRFSFLVNSLYIILAFVSMVNRAPYFIIADVCFHPTISAGFWCQTWLWPWWWQRLWRRPGLFFHGVKLPLVWTMFPFVIRLILKDSYYVLVLLSRSAEC